MACEAAAVVWGESCFDERTNGVRPEGALLATAASAAEALTRGPRLVGGGRMRGPSVVTLVLYGVFGGAGAWLKP
jgi:hypothetical protein